MLFFGKSSSIDSRKEECPRSEKSYIYKRPGLLHRQRVVHSIRRFPRVELYRERRRLARASHRIQHRRFQDNVARVPIPLSAVRHAALLQRPEVRRPVVDQDAAVALDGFDGCWA